MPHRKPIQLTFSLDFLTPAILGGYQPRRVDPYMPLRPASLRGLWRYWFRALAASLMWPERGKAGEKAMVKALLEAEARLFGDTRGRSRVVIPPPTLTHPKSHVNIPQKLPIPDQYRNPGLRYLGYGLFEDKDRRPPECIPEGTQAELTCTLRPSGRDAPPIRALCATIWTWAAFGGIGGRSRRGYGSVQLTKIKTSEQHAEIVQPWLDLLALRSSPDAYLNALRDGIGRAQDAMLEFLRDEQLGEAQLNGDSSGPHSAIRTLDGLAMARGLKHRYSSGRDALEHAGSLFQSFRSTLRRRDRGQPPLADYFEVKGSLKHPFTPPRDVARAAFGLPLRFYYRSLGGASTSFAPKPPFAMPGRPDRVASPLLFRVYRLTGDKYGVALLNLAGKKSASPLQGCEIVQFRKEGSIPSPSAKIIDDFIDWAVSQPRVTATKPRGRRRR